MILKPQSAISGVIAYRVAMRALCLCGLALWALAAPYPAQAAEDILLDRVIVTVNRQAILESDLRHQVNVLRAQAQARQTNPSTSELEERALNYLIDQSVMLQAAAQYGIAVSDAELDAFVSQIARDNNLTLTAFRQQLEASGESYLKFREQARKNRLIARLQYDQIGRHVFISEREIDDYVDSLAAAGNEKYTLQRIILQPDAPVNAEAILQQLSEGADFSALVKRYSQAPEAEIANGGNIGTYALGNLPLSYANALSRAGSGDTVGPIQTSAGVQLLHVVQKDTPVQMLDELKVRHIVLVPNSLRDSQQTYLALLQLRQQLLAGAPFETIAKANNEDTTRSTGGDLGWVSALSTDLPGPLLQQIGQLDVGQLSEPIQSPTGWHLVEVQEKRATDATRRIKKRLARRTLQEQKSTEQIAQWLEKIRSEAYIEYLAEEFEPSTTS